jgi:arginyl-tRNA synthetase
VYLATQSRIQQAVRDFAQRQWQLEVNVVVNIPPQPQMGDMALVLAMELARKLRRPPRQIAEEIAAELRKVEGIAKVEVAGAGYVNIFLDRSEYAARMVVGDQRQTPAAPGKIIVEHTNINPNKAAHIGHLRNAALGDTFIRLLRARGHQVEVQNYIDNTGVQVADVVAGFIHLESKSAEDVAKIIADPNVRFDYYCWDLYARISRYFEEDKSRLELRRRTLQEIEHGEGAAARMAELVATEIVRCHLRTMNRLSVEYDVLPRESEILHMRFWDQAFELLKGRGAIHLETEGKNAGCWVMRQKESDASSATENGPEGESGVSSFDEDKVIVRSNGTVTYVGKDIAYQLWKFGLLGRDFKYQPFHTYASGKILWASTFEEGDKSAPTFGRGHKVYNVIDVRQSYLQDIVAQGLLSLGYISEAERSVHFSYEMVALSPRTCEMMGIELTAEDKARPFVEVSGRKGLGIKADDLIDRLIVEARREVDVRHPEDAESLRADIAQKIAIGALRYFLLKFTCTSVIAFDLQDALAFEGETGPYVQYAVVRARSIFRKLAEDGGSFDPSFVTPELLAIFLNGPDSESFWTLVYLASRWEAAVEQAVATCEPAAAAKYSFQLAQSLNNFYHQHRILIEPDPTRKTFLLWVASVVERRLTQTLDTLGIEVPSAM